MKYYYNNPMSKRHYLQCKKVAHEWVNEDLPDIYRMDGTRAIEVTFPEYKVMIYADNEKEALELQHFVWKSSGKLAELYY